MISLQVKKFAEIVDGEINGLNSSEYVRLRPTIDSREAQVGTFFIAFEGEKVDGHKFCDEAITNGAKFSLVSKPVMSPHILVKDTLGALVKLAKYNRENLNNMKVIGITGSSGKTTTKDLATHLLSILGNTISPKSSFNNELGVPLLIASCDELTKFCIVEMGARHRGDIAHLAELAQPQIGVVLNVGSAHLGEFGSVEAIAEAKSELIAGLPDNGIAILGDYDAYTPKMAEGMGLRKITFGEKLGCEVRAADIEVREGRASFDLVTPTGRASVTLQLLGMHQISNALAAASIGYALDENVETIAAALSTATLPSKWRMEVREVNDVFLINDSYNANPESMVAALRTLALISQERGGSSWAFLGKMHELGESSSFEHARVGKIAADIGIDHLVIIGEPNFLSEIRDSETMGHLVANKESALDFVNHLQPGDSVLIKASRAEGLEQLAIQIINSLETRSAEV